MPQHERYLLQIWRSQGLAGRQWVARLDSLANGERQRFTTPEALLDHVRVVVVGPREQEEEEANSF